MITPGFRGTVKIIPVDSTGFFLRVSSVNIQKNQEAEPFLPVYGGTGLRRIWHIGTADILVDIDFPLTEDLFEKVLPLANEITEFDVEITYYNGAGRSATNCFVDNMSINCIAGEVAKVSMSILAKESSELSYGTNRYFTKGEKLLTWDKCDVEFSQYGLYDNSVQAFTYDIANNLVSVKTAASLTPSIINNGIQNITGDIILFDVAYPHLGDEDYELGFTDLVFHFDDESIRHNVVFDPNENVPLNPNAIISTISWSKSDPF